MREVFKTLLIRTVALVLCSCLMACGGGGDTPHSPGSPDVVFERLTPFHSDNGLAFYGDATSVVNASAGLVVIANDGASLSQVRWQQIAGPTMELLSAQSQAIGFDVSSAGSYTFTVNAVTQDGETRSASVTISVLPPSDPVVNLRLDHMATERGRISIRIDSQENKVITATQWQQLAGPPATSITFQEDSTSGPVRSAFMDAPSVSKDEVLAFNVIATFDDGTTGSDDVYIGVKNAEQLDEGIFTQNDMYVTSDIKPYRPASPYAQALMDCVYTNTLVNSCSFSELPLIGMENTTPHLETILERTLVSHAWMGDRFAEFLSHSTVSSDMLQLLRGVTAIVISYDVRPSFYWVRTGAIYLDASNFWRTPEERDTLNTAPDYRSDFGSDLQFGIFWRYVKDNQYYFPQTSLPLHARGKRSFDQLEASLSWLMYHELAHANDFFPPASWATIQPSSSPIRHFERVGTQSSMMADQYPLQSELLHQLAEVSFGGREASATQRDVSATDVANEFSADIAPGYYAYFTEREDYALLFEQFMMLYRLDVSADIAVIGLNNNDNAAITWGQRHRINQDTIQARTAFVVERILPNLNVATIQGTLPSPRIMPSGQSWFNLLDLGESTHRQHVTTSFQTDVTPSHSVPLQLPVFERHLY